MFFFEDSNGHLNFFDSFRFLRVPPADGATAVVVGAAADGKHLHGKKPDEILQKSGKIKQNMTNGFWTFGQKLSKLIQNPAN